METHDQVFCGCESNRKKWWFMSDARLDVLVDRRFLRAAWL